MNSKEAIRIAKEVANELKKAKFTESMYIIGSLSTGHYDKYGDIDTVITTNKKVYAKEIFPVIKKIITDNDKIIYDTDVKEFPYRIDLKIKGVKIMLFFILEDWILADITNYAKIKKHEYTKQANYIRTKRSIILFDKKNKLRNIVSKISELSLEMKKYILHERMHKLNYYLFLEDGAINTERKRKNIIEANFIIGDIINNIYECIYALNGKIMTDRKWAPQEISKFKKKPKNTIKKLEIISKSNNSKKELVKKISELRKITKELKICVEKEKIKDLPELKVPK